MEKRTKTPAYQKKASADYTHRQKKEGKERYTKWIKSEWRQKIDALIQELKEKGF